MDKNSENDWYTLVRRSRSEKDARHMATVVWERGYEKWGVDDIIAALEYNDRIWGIYFWSSGKFLTSQTSQMGRILAAMKQPFPVLRDMELMAGDETGPLDFASFLGGSASCPFFKIST